MTVAALLGVTAEQGVELLRHQFAVLVELVQKAAGIGIAQGAGNPQQIIVACGQHVGLLVVQVLDAVFHLAQEDVGAAQRIGNLGAHQIGLHQALQGFQRGSAAQLGELAAAHHLQQLHDEFDLADAAARELDVIGALGVARAALGGVVADLAVQAAQRVKHRIVQIAAEHKGQHHAAQGLDVGGLDIGQRRHDAALEPGKALPLPAVDL